MQKNKIVVFVSDPQYAPAKQFVDLLTSSGRFQVRGLKRSHAVVSTTSETVEWSNTNLLNGKNAVQEVVLQLLVVVW